MSDVPVQEKLWNANYTKVWLANFMIFFSFMLLTPLLPIYLNEHFGADKDMKKADRIAILGMKDILEGTDEKGKEE